MATIPSVETSGVTPPLTLPVRTSLGFWDVVSLNIGIVIGASIFKVPGSVFELCGSPAAALALWGLGALLALAGALCYAELAAAYPAFGAEYVYLGRAYGHQIGFLFGWIQTFVILPTSVGAMAFVFAAYGGEVWPAVQSQPGLTAAAAIAGLSILQLIGFQVGRIAQNLLTGIKVLSLLGVVVCGLFLSPPVEVVAAVPSEKISWSGLGLALVFVFYAYGGWSDVARVTPEVRDCRRTMPRGLITGLSIIAVIYLLLNLSFLNSLGDDAVRHVTAPAAEVVRRTLGSRFSVLMSLVVMASALGAIHGMLFSGCRLLAAIGEDYRLFRKWNSWNARHVPVWALLTLSLISLATTALVGTKIGRESIDRFLILLRLAPADLEKYGGGFEVLVTASSSVFWGFFLLSGLAVIVLRMRDPLRARPFRVPLYPVTPLIFIAICGYMLWSVGSYAGKLTLLMIPAILPGILLAFLQRRPANNSSRDPD